MRLRTFGGLLIASLALFCAPPATASTQNARRPAAKKQAGAARAGSVVARVWHGRTPAAKADEYYEYLREAGVKKILGIEGNLGVQVFRRTEGDVTEFTVISYWESLDAIRRYAGDDIEKTRHLPRDPEYLLELEPTVKHHQVVLDERRP